jgi:hypothetical protein
LNSQLYDHLLPKYIHAFTRNFQQGSLMMDTIANLAPKSIACHRMDTCRYLHWMVEDPLAFPTPATPSAQDALTKSQMNSNSVSRSKLPDIAIPLFPFLFIYFEYQKSFVIFNLTVFSLPVLRNICIFISMNPISNFHNRHFSRLNGSIAI